MTLPSVAPAQPAGPHNPLPLVAWLAVFLCAGSGFWVVLDTQTQLRALASDPGMSGPLRATSELLTSSHLMTLAVTTFLSLLGVALAALWTQTRLRQQFQALRHATLQAQAADAWSPGAMTPPAGPSADTLLQTAEHVRWTAQQVITATAGLTHVVESLTAQAIADMAARSPSSTHSLPQVAPMGAPKLSLAWPPADSHHG